MKQQVVGLLAHVDAGKTTLAEAMLYGAGAIRTLGRVDHKDAFLDFDDIERERGITVFSKQASLEYEDVSITLLDAPGHADFGAEAERTLQVLDCAVLVVAANEGVGGRTRSLWKLLDHYGVPTMVFVNKLDLYGGSKDEIAALLKARLHEGCADIGAIDNADVQEELAMADESALEEYVETGALGKEALLHLFEHRQLFPCVYGSALRMEGVDVLLRTIARFTPHRNWPDGFGARVYKVSHGPRGERLAWLKVTGGTLHAKDMVAGVDGKGHAWEDKADQIRIYSGAKHHVAGEVPAGNICAVVGLSHVAPGDGLGCEGRAAPQVLSPVLEYAVHPCDCDMHAAYEALRALADEEPLLGLVWDEELQEARVQLMGAVQLEVVRQRLKTMQGLNVDFGVGSILYKETIGKSVVGIGHFEPLRHYAEVHVLLEPLERGAGVEFGTVCLEDDLDRNWQRLILTNAMERTHRGVLTGSPITDLRITLLGGRAHPKHTEGGDFRQATYRAIRNGLMQAQSVLLEPWYEFELAVPANRVGRALGDLQRMKARFDMPLTAGDEVIIVGSVPASEVGEYPLQVSAYTAGEGSMSLQFGGYEPCHDASEVVSAKDYDPVADLPHTPDSVFCSHGAGYNVPWNEVASHAHVKCDPARRRSYQAADESFFASR